MFTIASFKIVIQEEETDLGNHKPAILEFYIYFENNYVGHKTKFAIMSVVILIVAILLEHRLYCFLTFNLTKKQRKKDLKFLFVFSKRI